MPYKLFLEGQEIPLADEIAATDETLRNTFVAFYPELGTADIKREEKDGVVEIRMVKRAGTKGNPVQSLIAAPSSINPAIALSLQLTHRQMQEVLSIEDLIAIQADIEEAIDVGNAWEKQTTQTLRAILKCTPIASTLPILGI